MSCRYGSVKLDFASAAFYNITSCLLTVRDSRHAHTNSRRLNKNPTIGENQPEKEKKKLRKINKTDKKRLPLVCYVQGGTPKSKGGNARRKI